MRPLVLIAGLLTVATASALGGYWLAKPVQPEVVTRGEVAVEAAVEAALPRPAQASVPATAGAPVLPTLAPMLEKVMPAVVNIYTQQTVRTRGSLAELFGFPGMPQQRMQQSLGSGVIVDAERGLILTNNHVIEGAEAVSVSLSDGRTVEAEFVGADTDTDVAVIRISADNLTALPLANTEALRVGDFVVAVGNPFGLGQTVTSGIVSALGRSGIQGLGYQNFIQTDASINPGNSGGALVNLNGELVGINTAIYSRSGGSVGIGFAIPANLAREVMRQLMAYGEVRRGSLGVESENLTPAAIAELELPANSRGALVVRVYRGSPAEVAGLRPGDVVVAANGQRVDNAQGLRNLEGLLPVGQPLTLEILRGGQRLNMRATLRATPKEIDGASLDPRLAGATFAELPERWRQQGLRGVVVSKVVPGSRAEQNGLRAGDRIGRVGDRQQTEDLPSLRAALAERPPELVLWLARGRRDGYLVMR